MRWVSIFGYATILILTTHALPLLGDLVGGEDTPIDVDSASEFVAALLLPAMASFLLAGAASIVVFSLLTYRTRGRALPYVILVTLLVWVTSLPTSVLLPGRPWVVDVVLWVPGGLFMALWAGIGLKVGTRYQASRARSGPALS